MAIFLVFVSSSLLLRRIDRKIHTVAVFGVQGSSLVVAGVGVEDFNLVLAFVDFAERTV